MVLPIRGLVAQIPAALLVPVFFIGKARFGRGIGAAYLLAYFGYAAWRISAA